MQQNVVNVSISAIVRFSMLGPYISPRLINTTRNKNQLLTLLGRTTDCEAKELKVQKSHLPRQNLQKIPKKRDETVEKGTNPYEREDKHTIGLGSIGEGHCSIPDQALEWTWDNVKSCSAKSCLHRGERCTSSSEESYK